MAQTSLAQPLAHDTITTFTLPAIPSTLRSPEARAEYLVEHYWDNTDFADTNYVRHADIMEQAWVNYLDLMPYTSAEISKEAIKDVFRKAEVQEKSFLYFAEMADKYLYDPNSPMRNDELYLSALDAMLASHILSDAEKIRLRHRKALALNNRKGTQALNFTFTLSSGKQGTLHSIDSPYILLYINDPGCHACHETLEQLKHNDIIRHMIDRKQLQVLALYPYEDLNEWRRNLDLFPDSWLNGYDKGQVLMRKSLYDLKAMPTIYLLDHRKLVLLKDASPAQVTQYLLKHADTE